MEMVAILDFLGVFCNQVYLKWFDQISWLVFF